MHSRTRLTIENSGGRDRHDGASSAGFPTAGHYRGQAASHHHNQTTTTERVRMWIHEKHAQLVADNLSKKYKTDVVGYWATCSQRERY